MHHRFTLTATACAQQDIRKSRFVAVAGPVQDEGEARDFIASHSDATASHNCWAWRVGQAYRFSDDGEPGGTAGKPILQACDGLSLDHVAIVVTRWFGGVLLGSGGLIRAYGGTAALCLRDAATVELVDKIAGVVDCAFADLALMQARLTGFADVDVTGQDFTGTGALIHIAAPLHDKQAIERIVADVSSGRAALAWAEP